MIIEWRLNNKQSFSICKVEVFSQIDYSDEFCFISSREWNCNICGVNI